MPPCRLPRCNDGFAPGDSGVLVVAMNLVIGKEVHMHVVVVGAGAFLVVVFVWVLALSTYT